MKLYDREGTPNAARIRIVLAEKGLDDQVEFATVDLVAAEQKAPAFLAMNPIGKTPACSCSTTGWRSPNRPRSPNISTISMAIPVLTGRTPREKALIHMMQRRAEIMVIEPVDDYFHYGTPGLGAALRPWRKPEWDGRHEWGERRGAEAVANPALVRRVAARADLPGGRDPFDGGHIAVGGPGLRRGRRICRSRPGWPRSPRGASGCPPCPRCATAAARPSGRKMLRGGVR
ncbi:MAG: glutathione S-transferase N-terminal domain-containing protein [Sphingomonas sp.]